ncbi:MAG: TlpA family protein disulfide reductase [Armatimonadetes bacterium]|nr:TlpA family protein disulfide reductase [Armatimonadota bacterium]
MMLFLVYNIAHSQSNNSMKKDSLNEMLYHARKAFTNVYTAKYYVHLYQSKVEGGAIIRSGNVFLSRDTVDNPLGWDIRFEADNGMVYCYTRKEIKILDPNSRKIIIVDASQGASEMIKGNAISDLFFNVLTDTTAWQRILNLSNNISFEKDQYIDDAICKIVQVEYPDTELFSQLKTYLFINPNNFFTYQKINHSIFNNIQLIDTLSFSKIEINKPLDSSIFTIEKPDGYSEYRMSKTISKEKSLPLGSQSPKWSLLNQKGGYISSENLKGKILLLDFWYSTCGPCLEFMPIIQRVHERYQNQGVVVIGMNSKEKKTANAINFMRKNNYTYTLALQADSVAIAFCVDSYPTTYIIDDEGKIVYKEIGFNNQAEETINKTINAILNKNKE